MEKTTNTLDSVLKKTSPDQIAHFFDDNRNELLLAEKPFAQYMRTCIREKGLLQQDVFIRADIAEGYGYKIISEEKHTNQRDTILRLCIGARLSLEETQRALKIYGMSPLYARMPRDAILMVSLNKGGAEISEVNELLVKNQMRPLKGTEI